MTKTRSRRQPVLLESLDPAQRQAFAIMVGAFDGVQRVLKRKIPMGHKPTFSRMAQVVVVAALALVTVSLPAARTLAHCDGLDGPVVKAAQRALQTGNVDQVLIWVRPQDEDEIKKAFDETLAVRKLSPQAQALADRYFFETLVRIHRAGENAPYTGLKPAGRDLGLAIPAADKALETASDEALIELLTRKVQEGVRAHFEEVVKKKSFEPNDVAAGRNYVEAYVTYIHYVERLYEAAEKQVSGHYAETD